MKLAALLLLAAAAVTAEERREGFPTFDNFPVSSVTSEDTRTKRDPQYSPAPPAPYAPAPYVPPQSYAPAAPVYHEPAPAYHEPAPAYAPVPAYHEPEPYHEPHHNEHGVPGHACVDYPCLAEAPYTKFTCASAPFAPGMYADVDSGCQVSVILL